MSRAYKIARPFAVSLGHFAAASANLTRRAFAGEAAYPGLVSLLRAVYGEIRGGAPAFAPGHAVRVARARDEILAAAGI